MPIVPCVNCRSPMEQIADDILHCGECGFSFRFDDVQIQHEREIEWGLSLIAQRLHRTRRDRFLRQLN